jgi:hypothetical protein
MIQLPAVMALAATFSGHGRLQNQSLHGARCPLRQRRKSRAKNTPEEMEEDD